MAALIDSARAARREAQRLRSDSFKLKLVLRSTARTNEARKATAHAAAETARATRANPHASAWSGLLWLREDRSLERVLVLVD